jgi:hypothetical protein
MRSKPPPQPEPTPDERAHARRLALYQDYRELLAEVARLNAQWLLDDRIDFALRNHRQV